MAGRGEEVSKQPSTGAPEAHGGWEGINIRGSWREGDIHYCLCDKLLFGSHDREG